MSDLLVFAAIVGLVTVVGVVLGIIVAGRLDRVLARSDEPHQADEPHHADDGPPPTRAGAAGIAPDQEDPT